MRARYTQAALKRTLAFADYADLLWLETKAPDLKQAQSFAADIREKYPGKRVNLSLLGARGLLRPQHTEQSPGPHFGLAGGSSTTCRRRSTGARTASPTSSSSRSFGTSARPAS